MAEYGGKITHYLEHDPQDGIFGLKATLKPGYGMNMNTIIS